MTRRTSLTVAVWTSVLFLVVYNACNWITKQRPDTQVWAFGWEHSIPLWEWMIVPYWSLDAFFVAAPFLCRERQDLHVLRRRLETAILAGGACFLLVPLRFAWARPQVDGFFGPWFQTLHQMDAPHNLFPSLHITLRTILAAHFARHTHGAIRFVSHAWFSLIGLSTLFTHQHHVIDILGGFALAWICASAFPLRPTGAERNPRIGCYYLIGTAAALSLARIAPPWSLLLLWPAGALGTVAAAYFGAGAHVLRKCQGILPTLTRIWLAPWLLGQGLSLRYYRRRSAPWNEIQPGVWIGCLPTANQAQAARTAGVTAVLDLTAEFTECMPFRHATAYLSLPVMDLTAPHEQSLREAAAFIEAERQRGVVYVHCKAGYSRSAAAVGAWLLLSGRCHSAEDAAELLKTQRPGMIIRPEIMAALERLAQA